MAEIAHYLLDHGYAFLMEKPMGFNAEQVGGVADKELLPWNSKIAVDMNYRAAVETLTNGSSGILDIL